MASALVFEFEEPDEERAFYNLLADFLQPDSEITLESATQTVLDNLACPTTPTSHDVRVFSSECAQMAELIPYDHPSMVKLVTLILEVHQSAEFMHDWIADDGTMHQRFKYQIFKETLVDWYDTVDPGFTKAEEGEEVTPLDVSKCANFHAFLAQFDYHILRLRDQTFAVRALREAHENNRDLQGLARDAHAMAAAQWIIICGDMIFECVRKPSEQRRRWSEGLRYKEDLLEQVPQKEEEKPTKQRWHFLKKGFTAIACGQRDQEEQREDGMLTLQRWEFWKNGFTAIASGRRDYEKGTPFTQESKELSAKAARIMEELEMEHGTPKKAQ